MTTADLPSVDLEMPLLPGAGPFRSAGGAAGAGSAGLLLVPTASLRGGPLRCPSCDHGLVVLEVLGDLRFRCDRCVLEWRYGLGQLWGVGDGLGDQVP